MIFQRTRCVRQVAGLLVGSAIIFAAPAFAQTTPPGFVQVPEDAGTALARHMVAIGKDPRDVQALKGAGEAALELGDAQASLGFYAHAEEVAPRDGRVKAGMASALVQLEQPRPALRFFDEAVDLGVPEVEIAGDRGLAYDLIGNSKRAQKDYQLALKRKDDPEVRRRLALSLGISGDRQAALNAIQGQLQQQDQAAWRARAFILALTGDSEAANQAAAAVMPAGTAKALEPFLARLSTLRPADRAIAVTFGHLPETNTAASAAAGQQSVAVAPRVAPSITDAGTPDPIQRPLGQAAPRAPATTTFVPVQSPPAAAAPRSVLAPATVPQSAQATAQPLSQAPGSGAIAASAPPGQTLASAPASTAPTSPSVSPSIASPPAVLAGTGGPAQGATNVNAAPAAPSPSIAAAEPSVAIGDSTPLSSAPVELASAESSIVSAELPKSSLDSFSLSGPVTVAAAPRSRLADVAALLESLPAGPAEEEAAPAPRPVRAEPAAKKPAAAPAPAKGDKPAAKAGTAKGATAKDPPKPAKKAPAPPKEPSRIWVQVSGGADKGSLPREFARLKAKAPKLFAGRTAWTTPLKATNRLLVGPFATDEEAREFVNKLAKADLSGFSWTSPQGQAVEKLPAK